METTIILRLKGLYRDYGKENGNFYNLNRGYIRIVNINGNYHLGF